MKGGIGTAAIELPNGLLVAALVAVNAVGDVVDPATGQVVAGVRTDDGRGFADARKLLRLAGSPGGRPGENTTIGVVATSARLTKAQATKVAQMAHDGLARAIYPAHTPADGDTLFALALGTQEGEVNLAVLGALAADATSEAILSAVRSAESAAGYPSVRELDARRSP
jgi:L-aminopeptidase/D-esterase-like protein